MVPSNPTSTGNRAALCVLGAASHDFPELLLPARNLEVDVLPNQVQIESALVLEGAVELFDTGVLPLRGGKEEGELFDGEDCWEGARCQESAG